MTAVILTFIGVLLAAVAAMMTMYYGGRSFDRGVIGA